MKTSVNGRIALAVSEGLVDTAYLDSVGVWTIGIGHTKTAGGIDPKAYIGKTLTTQQIMDLFASDLPKYEAIINKLVKVSLKQNEFDALVHFVYNVGEGNFAKSKLLANLNAGNKATAWQSGFHGFLKPASLKGRRDKERAIAQTGNYGSTIAPLYTADRNGKLKKKGTVNLSTVIKGDVTPPTSNTPVVNTPTETKPQTSGGFINFIVNLLTLIFSKKQ